jgi:nicotinate-nucleotide adenylyltransferase
MDKKTGLFFGSFNPIHTGHLIISNFMATKTDLDEVWLVISPHNPLKRKSSLAPERDRQHLVEIAIKDNDNLRSSDIEFYLPQPSYTVDTLIHLREKFPERHFCLIMGADNLKSIKKWKNFEILLRDYEIYLYNRPGFEIDQKIIENAKIHYFNSPSINISSTYIRNCIKEGKSIRYLVPDVVKDYMINNNFYKK